MLRRDNIDETAFAALTAPSATVSMLEVTTLPAFSLQVEACSSAFLPLAGVAFLTAFLVTDSAASLAFGAAWVLATFFAAGALAAAFFAADLALAGAFFVAAAATLAVSFFGRPGAFFFVTPVGFAPLAFGAAAFFFLGAAGS